MKKTSATPPRRPARSAADIEPEYDWSKAVRNPYAARYAAGLNIVVLEPDVAVARCARVLFDSLAAWVNVRFAAGCQPRTQQALARKH